MLLDLLKDDFFENQSLVKMFSVKTEDNEIRVKISAPGFDKKDLGLDIKGNHIILETKDGTNSFYLHSLSEADTSNTKASLDKGVLLLKIPLKNQRSISID